MAKSQNKTAEANDDEEANLDIDASPTKTFFIYMLVKDVPLIPAIIDLVDNSLDGARRLRSSGKYAGLSVHLVVRKDQFEINDNCGGIPVDVARQYAFRFGRPEEMVATKHSVGQFGVGMKRALFKLGKHFSIKSATATSRFSVTVSVDQWRRQKVKTPRGEEEDWRFHFDAPPEEGIQVPVAERGTRITVGELHEAVAGEFDSDNFRSNLREQLESKHAQNVLRGLEITLNGNPLKVNPVRLLVAKNLQPAYKEMRLTAKKANDVRVRIWVGLGSSEPEEAGWYVFCNDRMILQADQSRTTGWEERADGGSIRIPKYHNQFAEFRGYVFMDSDDASTLPWNTTKTGVDTDNAIFRSVRREMLTLMRPVIDFLNKVKEETEAAKRDDRPAGPLANAVAKASLMPIDRAKTATVFMAPKAPPPKPAKPMAHFNFQVPKSRADQALDESGARSYRELGELTFDYYYKNEVGD
jgi:hypothetical protein